MERKEVFITNLSEAFTPQDLITSDGHKDTWQIVEYKTTKFDGEILMTQGINRAGDLTLDPKLEGWYKISILMPCSGSYRLYLKLATDNGYGFVYNTYSGLHNIEEWHWRCADMTNNSLSISRSMALIGTHSAIAGVRFTPMTDEEVEEYKFHTTRKETKRFYVAEDMNHMLTQCDMSDPQTWYTMLELYRDSDAEWISIEEIRNHYSKYQLDFENFSFSSDSERHLISQTIGVDFDSNMRMLTKAAHEMGLKISNSIRMGMWGCGFPWSIAGSGNYFADAHPEWSCYDRNGERETALSYAYPEVRKFMIDQLVNAARCGADAVTLLACRGIPFVLFEKPVCDLFYERYGEDAREYPLDDPKLNAIHCEFMTTFFRELREALDNEFGKNKVEIHLRGYYAILDCKYLGFDVETLAKEGLINVYINHYKRFFEVISNDFRKEDDPSKIDVEKFDAFIYGDDMTTDLRFDRRIFDSYKNSRGEVIPESTVQSTAKEWVEFGKKYGVKIYIEVNCPENHEGLTKFAQEMYDLGVDGISRFNTVMVALNPITWSTARFIGHRDEFDTVKPTERTIYRVIKHGPCYSNRYLAIWGG